VDSSASTSEQTGSTSIATNTDVERRPQVLLAIRLQESYFADNDDDRRKQIQDWREWLRNIPLDAEYIKIQGIYEIFSTLLLLSMAVAVWDLLQNNPAYSFVGLISSENKFGTPLNRTQQLAEHLAFYRIYEITPEHSDQHSYGIQEIEHDDEFIIPVQHQVQRQRSLETPLIVVLVRLNEPKTHVLLIQFTKGNRQPHKAAWTSLEVPSRSTKSSPKQRGVRHGIKLASFAISNTTLG
jgi:hypothetical protein